MAKPYINDVGTELRVDTETDLTTATTLQFKIKKPDLTTATWTATVPSGLGADDGIIHYIITSGDFDQAGKYLVQAYVVFTGGNKFLGETASFTVYEAFK